MTGARITVDSKPKGFRPRCRGRGPLDAPGDLMDAVGAVIEEAIDRRFDAESDAQGTPWPESLRAGPGLRGGGTLTDTGRLRGSISRSVSGPEVAVGTNLVYAAIHHFGGTIVPKEAGENAAVKSVTLPARPWLEIDAVAEADIADVVAEYLRKALAA